MPCLLSVILRNEARVSNSPLQLQATQQDAPEEVKAKLLDVLLERDDLDARVGPANPQESARVRTPASAREHSLLDEARRVGVVPSAAGRHVVVDGGEGAVVAADLAASVAETLKSLLSPSQRWSSETAGREGALADW